MAEKQENNVEIRQNISRKGRGLFTRQNFKTGDVLFSESPLVSVQFAWNALYKYTACDHCMKSLETAEKMYRRLASNPGFELPHPDCCEVRKEEHVTCPKCQIKYCSENCRTLAWDQYHETLCLQTVPTEELNHPLLNLLEVWRNIHYPPETCNIMLLARMIATVKQSKDRAKTKAAFSQFCKASVNEEENIAHKLLGKQFEGQLDLLRTLLMAFLHDDDLEQWFTPQGFRSLFALIGTNGQGIGTSSFSVWVKNCEKQNMSDTEKEEHADLIDKLYSDMDKVSGEFLDCEGSGLYELQSCCNHSCVPNAEVTFPNNNFVLSVKALSDIKEGDEIEISYLGECDIDRSRHSRQKLLRENYLFNCQCERCQSQLDDPDMTSEEEECDSDEDGMDTDG